MKNINLKIEMKNVDLGLEKWDLNFTNLEVENLGFIILEYKN